MAKYDLVFTNFTYNTQNPVKHADSLQDALKLAVKSAIMYKAVEIKVPIPGDKYYRTKKIGQVVAIPDFDGFSYRYIYITSKGIRELTKSGNYKKM